MEIHRDQSSHAGVISRCLFLYSLIAPLIISTGFMMLHGLSVNSLKIYQITTMSCGRDNHWVHVIAYERGHVHGFLLANSQIQNTFRRYV